MIFWALSDVKPNGKNLCELLSLKRPDGNSKTLQESMGISSVSR
jgi:hypothetical protein